MKTTKKDGRRSKSKRKRKGGEKARDREKEEKKQEKEERRRKQEKEKRGKKKQKKEERRMVRGRLSEARPPRVQGCGKSRVGLLMDLWKFMVGRRDGWRNHK